VSYAVAGGLANEPSRTLHLRSLVGKSEAAAEYSSVALRVCVDFVFEGQRSMSDCSPVFVADSNFRAARIDR
jgi:hypothetical protein